MVIIIPIETTRRELLYKTYLCHLLVLRGFTCYLGNKSMINSLLTKFTNYIYLDKGYHQGKSDKIYSTIKSQNGLIASLDEEGAVDFSDNRTLLKRYSKELFNLVDVVFMWGKEQKDIINLDTNYSAKIVISGHPRFELLKPKYHQFYIENANILKERYKKFILISTNMGFGNNIKGDDFVKDGYGKWYSEIEEIINYDKLKLDAYITFVKKLSANYDGNIIVRPHPEEDLSVYKRELSSYKNVYVENKDSVVSWILASEVMIHPDCTTSIESFFLGKKPISLLPKEDAVSHITKLPLTISTCINSFEEFNKALEINSINTTNTNTLDDYFSLNTNTTNIIVDELVNLSKNRQNFNQTISTKDYLFLNFKAIKSKLSLNKAKKLQRTKLQGLNKKDINRIHQSALIINSALEKVAIKKVSDKLFCFKAQK